jgi:hypothetical protein
MEAACDLARAWFAGAQKKIRCGYHWRSAVGSAYGVRSVIAPPISGRGKTGLGESNHPMSGFVSFSRPSGVFLMGYKPAVLGQRRTNRAPAKTYRRCAAELAKQSAEPLSPFTAVVAAAHGFVAIADLLPKTETTLRPRQTPRQEGAQLGMASLALGPGALCRPVLSWFPW